MVTSTYVCELEEYERNTLLCELPDYTLEGRTRLRNLECCLLGGLDFLVLLNLIGGWGRREQNNLMRLKVWVGRIRRS